MFRRRAGSRRTAALALAGIALAALAISFLARADTASAAATLVIGAPGTYDGHGATINVNCGADNNVLIRANNVTLKNYVLLNANEAAVSIDEEQGTYSNIIVENVTIKGYNCANGDGQYRAGVACWYCTALTVRNSHIERPRGQGDGIWVKNDGDPSNGPGGGHSFTGNTIIGGWDGIGGEPEDQPYGGVYKNTLIQGNTVTGCDDDGIQVEGGNVNVRVKSNTVSGCGIGVAFAPNITGPLYIENNVLKNMIVAPYGQQAAFKIGDADNSGATGIAYVTGNTINTPGDGFKQTNGGLSPIVSSQNCVVVGRYVIEFGDPVAAGTSFNNDTLWSTDDEGAGRFIKWGGNKYGSLAEFRAATGQETAGTQAQCGSPPAAPPPAPPPAPNPPPASGGSGGEQVSNSLPKPAANTAPVKPSPPKPAEPDYSGEAAARRALLISVLSGDEATEAAAERALAGMDGYDLQKDVWVPLGLVVSLLGLDALRRWRRARRAPPGAPA
jgi:hypothetical protein